MTSRAVDRRPVVAIVDDEEDILIFLCLALEDHGFDVVVTSDPDSAFALLVEKQPDLICLDLLMPRHTGVGLYSEISRHPELSKCPTLIMSGLAVRNELPDMLRRAGDFPEPAGFIEKPIVIDELVATINRLVSRSVEVSA
ncbi:MAG: response regulator [bacterium]|nr:response regulator [bacterium]